MAARGFYRRGSFVCRIRALSSRRLARFIAAALGLPSKAAAYADLPCRGSHCSPPTKSRSGRMGLSTTSGTSKVLSLRLLRIQLAHRWRQTRTSGTTFETRISGLVPNRYYLVVVSYKPIGDRMINLFCATPQGKRASHGAIPRGSKPVGAPTFMMEA